MGDETMGKMSFHREKYHSLRKNSRVRKKNPICLISSSLGVFTLPKA